MWVGVTMGFTVENTAQPSRRDAQEGQQLGAGIRISNSRLEKIEAASKQTKLEIERSSKAASNASQAAAATSTDTAESDEPAPTADAPQILRLGKVVALASVDPATEVYRWECGRVQKMLRRSKGKTGEPVPFTEPMLFMDAVEAKVLVVCSWYTRDAKSKGYTFIYNAAPDSKPYSRTLSGWLSWLCRSTTDMICWTKRKALDWTLHCS